MQIRGKGSTTSDASPYRDDLSSVILTLHVFPKSAAEKFTDLPHCGYPNRAIRKFFHFE
jgi:hypothetical protein